MFLNYRSLCLHSASLVVDEFGTLFFGGRMSRLRERLYKEYNLEQLGYDFMGYTFDSKKELSTHHILPKNSGGKTDKKNLCVLNRFTSHNLLACM